MNIRSLACMLLLCMSNPVFAQQNCPEQTQPLSTPAFRKMMRDLYGFTILGSETPTTGFKIETEKPTISLKGNIYSSQEKRFITNLEITGGVADNIMNVFSGKHLNGYFKYNLGFNWLLGSNNKAYYTGLEPNDKIISRKTVCQYKEEIAKEVDTFLVLKTIINPDDQDNADITGAVKIIIGYAANDMYKIPDFKRVIAGGDNAYYDSLIKAIVKKYLKKSEVVMDYSSFIKNLTYINNQDIKTEELIKDYHRLLKIYKNPGNKNWSQKQKSLNLYENPDSSKAKSLIQKHFNDLIHAYEIETYKDIWNLKRIVWLNLSLTGSNSALQLYDRSLNTLTDTTSFLPGVSFSVNYLAKWKEASRFFYTKVGLNAQRINGLPDLETLDYKKETIINANPTETFKTEKAGTAYLGTLSHGFGFDLFIESYYVPWKKNFVPGLYFKVQYSHGDVWINKNKLPLDLGMIWNVASSDKESKNLLSVIPYVSWSSLLPVYKDITKAETRKMTDLFSVNVKFAIPVNIGK